MKINQLIERLEQIKEHQGGEIEVEVYFQNVKHSRDFDCVSLTKKDGEFIVWLSDLGD